MLSLRQAVDRRLTGSASGGLAGQYESVLCHAPVVAVVRLLCCFQIVHGYTLRDPLSWMQGGEASRETRPATGLIRPPADRPCATAAPVLASTADRHEHRALRADHRRRPGRERRTAGPARRQREPAQPAARRDPSGRVLPPDAAGARGTGGTAGAQGTAGARGTPRGRDGAGARYAAPTGAGPAGRVGPHALAGRR